MEEKNNFDAFYPFFIIIVVYLVSFFRKRAKMKREAEEKKRTVPIQRESPRYVTAPPPPIAVTVKIDTPSVRQKATPTVRKKKPRIVNIVQDLKSKKELVFLSEILFINPYIK